MMCCCLMHVQEINGVSDDASMQIVGSAEGLRCCSILQMYCYNFKNIKNSLEHHQ